VLAACPDRLAAARVATVVPDFAALAAVQDKVAAHRTLDRVGLPQPPTTVVPEADGLRAWEVFPAYVKLPIGTASRGVVRVEDGHQARRLADELTADGGFGPGGVVVQVALDGPLVMGQVRVRPGRLVASTPTCGCGRAPGEGPATSGRSTCRRSVTTSPSSAPTSPGTGPCRWTPSWSTGTPATSM